MRTKRWMTWMTAVIAFAALFLLPAVMMAQMNATGSIAGYITDDGKEPLPGATIIVTSPTMLGIRQALADSTGYYKVSALPPGRFMVVVDLDQFNKAIRDGVELNVGAMIRLDFALTTKKLTEEEIVVTADAPVVETEKTTVDTVITSNILDALPILGRNFMESVNILPGVTESTYGTSISGSRDTDKNYNIDGADNVDIAQGKVLSGGYSYQEDRPFMSFDQEAIQELSVGLGNFSADVGFGSGGFINVVTKSGSNAYHGSLYFQARNDKWDYKSSYPFESYYFGGSVGGPIVKDKLLFFLSLSPSRTTSGYDPRSWWTRNVPSSVKDGGWSGSAFMKLTYLLNSKNTLHLSANIPWSSRDQRVTLYHIYPDFPLATRKMAGYSLNINETAIISPNVMLESTVAAGYTDNRDVNTSKAHPGWILTYGEQVTATGTNIVDGYFKRTKANWSEKLTLYVDNAMGRHTIFSGVEVRYNGSAQHQEYSEMIASFDPAIYGFDYTSSTITYPYTLKFNQTYIAGYVTDSWAPSKRWTLRPGVRLTRNSYMPKLLVEPRFDFAFVPFNDTKTVIRGGANFYYERVNTYAQQLANQPLAFNSYTIFGMHFEYWSDKYYLIDPNMKYPRTTEFVLGIDRELFKDVSLSANFVYRDFKDQFFTRFINLRDRVTELRDDPNLPVQSFYSNLGNSKYRGLSVILQKRYSHGYQFLLSYSYQYSRGNSNLFLDFSQLQMIEGDYYLYKGDPQLSDYQGRTAYDKPYDFKAFGSVVLPLKFVLSGIFNLTAGSPYTSYSSINGKMVSSYQALRSPYLMNLNLRVEKDFKFGWGVFKLMIDGFNVLNRDNIIEVLADVDDPGYLTPYQISDPRRIQVGARFEF
jgi:outer membrane receptor for ferrienterochelin and colicin